MIGKKRPVNGKSGSSRKKVYLVDDHPVVQLGVRQLIEEQPDLVICGQAQKATEAIEGVARLKPDAVVLDLTLKSGDGFEVLKSITTRFPAVPVLILSAHPESIFAELVLRAGAKGYFLKSQPLVDFLLAVRRVIGGGVYLSDTIAADVLSRQGRRVRSAQVSPLERLSERERQVLRLIGLGNTTREVARDLRLSVKTIEHYREKLKAKLGMSTAAALVQYALNLARNPPAQPGPGPIEPPGA